MRIFSWLCLAVLFTACNNDGKDSVEKADSSNEAKSDSNVNAKDTSTNHGVLGVDEATASFLTQVADVGMTEVELGKIAKEKASNKKVKDFGNMMVMDHTKAGEALKSLAMSKNVTLPTGVSADHQKKIDELSKKSGADFDKAYMDAMEDGHSSTVHDFEGQTDNKDADVKAFVNNTLPTLRKHLDAAKTIKKELK